MTLPASVLQDAATPRASAASLVERYRPVFDEIGAGAVARENERRLPFAEVELLRASGFTRVTLPRDLGGEAVDHLTLFELLADSPKVPRTAVVNGDDPAAAGMVRDLPLTVLTFGLGAGAAVRALEHASSLDAIHLTVATPRGTLRLTFLSAVVPWYCLVTLSN